MRFFSSVPLLLLGLVVPALGSDRTPPPVTPAMSYPAVEVHDKEKVAIAVEPYDTKEKEKLFHVEYTKYQVIPVRLIVTNMGDQPISLRDARILFETASGERIQAAEPEDVERRMNPREPHGAMPTPTPFPIPGIHPHRKNNNDKNVEEDFDTFEYQALVVEPHTTRAGFLFYAVPWQLADPLKGAHMSITRLRNADGDELFYFEIPFDKYLKATAAQTH